MGQCGRHELPRDQGNAHERRAQTRSPRLEKSRHAAAGDDGEKRINREGVSQPDVDPARHAHRQHRRGGEQGSPRLPVPLPRLPEKERSRGGEREKRERRLDRDRDGKEVPPSVAPNPAEQESGMTMSVMLPDPVDPQQELAGGEGHLQHGVAHARERSAASQRAIHRRQAHVMGPALGAGERGHREAIARPDDQEGDGGGEARPAHQRSEPPTPRGARRPLDRDPKREDGDGTRGQEDDGRKLREDREPGRAAEQKAAPPVGLVEPVHQRIDGQRKTGRQRGVGRRQARVSQDRRQGREQQYGRHGRAVAEEPPRPRPDYPRREHEKRKDSGASLGEVRLVLPGASQDAISLGIHLRRTARSEATRVEDRRRRDPCQRRMFDAEKMRGIEPFHPAGDVMGFVAGLEEDRVGENDPDEPHRREREKCDDRKRPGSSGRRRPAPRFQRGGVFHEGSP